jgi:methylmalonyl-CoA mutase N-terminal domain/subunit
MGSDKPDNRITTESGIPVKVVYTPDDLKNWDYKQKLGTPGEYPYTRGITPTMYRDNFWQMNQYAGFATAEETNQWFKYVIGQGAKALTLALDIPTQCGYDSDHPLAEGEVGKQGVTLNSLADLEAILDGIPLANMRFSCLANSIGPIYLGMLLTLLEKQGIPPQEVPMSMQNDVLKEFGFRGTYIFPPKPSVKVTCDVMEYCMRNKFRQARVLCICSYHMSEAGATPVQEIAFILADATAYIEELLRRGMNIDDFAPNMDIFIGTGMDLFEEACKLRALRRMWARMMKEKFHAKSPRSLTMTIRNYTRGSYFTAQQPLNNIIRGTIETLAGVLGGMQLNTTSSYDEALALPSPDSVTIALRTQQILAYESGVTNTVDPLGGSYFVEALTNELEERANKLYEEVHKMGGAIAAVEAGFYEKEVAKAGYERAKRRESGEKVIIGVNKFASQEPRKIEIRRIDPAAEQRQIERVRKLRKERDNDQVRAALKQVKEAAEEGVNLVPPMMIAAKAYATLGEMCDTLRRVYGEHRATRI